MSVQRASARILVSGMVQGVGFRFFVLREARRYRLGGYVRNLPSGKVEIEAEGDAGLLRDFLKEVRRGPLGAHVSAMDVSWGEASGQFDGFEIRF